MQNNQSETKKHILMILLIVALLTASVFACLATKYKTHLKNLEAESSSQESFRQNNTAIVGPYTLSLPSEYLYTVKDGKTIIADSTGHTWLMQIDYTDVFSFAKAYSDSSVLKLNFPQLQEVNIENSSVNGNRIIYMDAAKNNSKVTYMFFKADDTNTFVFELIDLSNIHNHELANVAHDIVKTAKKQKYPNSFKTDLQLFN